MAEQTPKLVTDGVKDAAVAEKKEEEKETVSEKKEKPIKPTENVESDFEIISKETTKEPVSKKSDSSTEKNLAENLVKTTNVNTETKKGETEDIKSVEKKIESDDKISETKHERKKSIVDISVIEETGESDDSIILKTENYLQESVSLMPGMTKSVSQEILKKSDVTELKQIAQDLAEEKEEEEEGSVIDISVVEENNDKEEDIGTVDGIEAEILGDDEEVTITPGEDEEVVELTLETRHMLPVLSAIVGLAAAIYALIFYTNV